LREDSDRIRGDGRLELPHLVAPMNPATVYAAAVDKERNVCSRISPIAHRFGAAIVPEHGGVVLEVQGRWLLYRTGAGENCKARQETRICTAHCRRPVTQGGAQR